MKFYRNINTLFIEHLRKTGKHNLVSKVENNTIRIVLKTIFCLLFWTLLTTFVLEPFFVVGGTIFSLIEKQYINIFIYIITPPIIGMIVKPSILYWQIKKHKNIPARYYILVMIPWVGTSIVSIYLLKNEKEILKEMRIFVKEIWIKGIFRNKK